MSDLVHASCVAIDGHAVLLCGRSGSGKSDLALRLLDRGAQLVSDDYTRITLRGGRAWAAPAPNIGGKIEVRGLGIIDWPSLPEAPLLLAILLDEPAERMPPAPLPLRRFGDAELPVLALAAHEASAPIKVELAVASQVAAKPSA